MGFKPILSAWKAEVLIITPIPQKKYFSFNVEKYSKTISWEGFFLKRGVKVSQLS